MNNYTSGGNRKGGGFKGKSSFRGGNNKGREQHSGGRQIQTFTAECSKCHKSCSLPFKPNGVKPVFCSDCFERQHDTDTRSGSRTEHRLSYEKPPRSERPARHNRQEPRVNEFGMEMTAMRQQLEKIESRLNRILDIINPPTPPTKKTNKTVTETSAIKSATDVKKVVKKVAKKTSKKVAKKVAKKVKKK